MKIVNYTIVMFLTLFLLTALMTVNAVNTKWTEHRVAYDDDGEPIIESKTNNFKCSLHCGNNGRLTKQGEGICGCQCTGQWSGKICDVCSLKATDCIYGSLNQETCSCNNCDAPWTGPFCRICGLKESESCQSINKETCRCTNKSDDNCQYSINDCQHGGTLNKECCQCDQCDQFWGGPLCNTCLRPKETSCINGGKLDDDTCKCVGCDPPFGGKYCEECMLERKECVHGGTICKSSCRCTGCSIPWSGPRCNSCNLVDTDCQHGVVDELPDTCQCKCNAPWTTDDNTGACSVCSVTKETCGPGTTVDLIGCRCVGDTTTHNTMLIDVKSKKRRLRSASFSMMNDKNTNVPPLAGTIISCTWTGIPDHMEDFVDPGISYYGRKRTGYLQHLFVASECTNSILPDPRQGIWMASMHSVYACGKPEQWSVLSPNEEDGPGIMWWNGQDCGEDGGASVRVDYFLPSKEYTKNLHRCVWQGAPERTTVIGAPSSSNIKGYGGKNDGGLSRSLTFKPWTQSSIDHDIRTMPSDVGNGEGDTNTVLDRFQSPEDERFWGDKGIKKGWDDKAPGYHRHVFTKSDCSNGLPPNDGRTCLK